ncbi:endospore germination permease [Longirhabdus pacifica]|uniref:endospore germination permease n=1 Tax=Longirhabdus pacifica TaxID=2305227 RepID=UPI0013E8D71E|nr:endospore germination permease [Longirhabdus pacifica]
MDKIKWYQILIMFSISISTINQIQVVPVMMSRADRDTWVAILFTVPPFLLWIVVLYFLIKKASKQHIYDWLTERTSSIFATCIISIGCLVILVSAYSTLKDVITWTSNTYLMQRPSVVLVVIFIMLSYYLVQSGLQTIVITAGVLLPIHFFLALTVYMWGFSYDNFYRVFPVFEHGIQSVAYGMMYAAAGFLSIFFILFLQHRISEPIKLRWLMLLGAYLVIDLLIPNLMGNAEFGPKETSRQRYPIYEQWRLIEVGRYIEHLDFLVIFEWLSGTLIHFSIQIFIVQEMISRMFNVVNRKALLRLICLLLALSYYIPLNDVRFFYLMENYFFSSVLIIYVLLTVVFILIPKKKKQKSQ